MASGSQQTGVFIALRPARPEVWKIESTRSLQWKAPNFRYLTPRKTTVLSGFFSTWRHSLMQLWRFLRLTKHCCRRLGSIPVGTRNLQSAVLTLELLTIKAMRRSAFAFLGVAGDILCEIPLDFEECLNLWAVDSMKRLIELRRQVVEE